jgi:hypothetical protein
VMPVKQSSICTFISLAEGLCTGHRGKKKLLLTWIAHKICLS